MTEVASASRGGSATAGRRLPSRAVVDRPEKPRAARRPDALAAVGVVAASAHEGAASSATPPPGRVPSDRRDISLRDVFVRAHRPISTACCGRRQPAVSRQFEQASRAENTGRVAAAGRRTWHARATDGNPCPQTVRARRRRFDNDVVNSSEPIAGCRADHSRRRAHREHRRWRIRLPCQPSYGPRTRLARCDRTAGRARLL
jgi:hypothetical protein